MKDGYVGLHNVNYGIYKTLVAEAFGILQGPGKNGHLIPAYSHSGIINLIIVNRTEFEWFNFRKK